MLNRFNIFFISFHSPLIYFLLSIHTSSSSYRKSFAFSILLIVLPLSSKVFCRIFLSYYSKLLSLSSKVLFLFLFFAMDIFPAEFCDNSEQALWREKVFYFGIFRNNIFPFKFLFPYSCFIRISPFIAFNAMKNRSYLSSINETLKEK